VHLRNLICFNIFWLKNDLILVFVRFFQFSHTFFSQFGYNNRQF